jgi:cAMP-dependent protein kinase regulator
MCEDFLKSMELLSSLTENDRNKLCDALKQINFKKGDFIITEGDNSADLFFLEKGQACAYKNKKQIKAYQRGDYFGELALLKNQKRALSIVATVMHVTRMIARL